jgi:hypothetical protein
MNEGGGLSVRLVAFQKKKPSLSGDGFFKNHFWFDTLSFGTFNIFQIAVPAMPKAIVINTAFFGSRIVIYFYQIVLAVVVKVIKSIIGCIGRYPGVNIITDFFGRG